MPLANPGNKGFTLLELIVVIIIIGIIATLGFTQYTQVVEKGRGAEAKALLSTLRTAEQAYYFENATYTNSISNLSVNLPTSCDTNHYFMFFVNTAAMGGRCAPETGLYAQRCTSGGKSPQASSYYYICVCQESGRWLNDAPY